MLRIPRVALLLVFCPSAVALTVQESTTSPPLSSCTPQSGAQHCSEPALQRAVAAASSVAIQSGPRDRVGAAQLRSLVTKIGKSLALDEQSADMTWKLSRVEHSGVNYGAADREIARLEVYANGGPAGQPRLIWVETLSGPADLSWPAAVSRLLDQFRRRIKSR